MISMRKLLALAFLTWIPLRGQAPGVGVDPSHNQKQQTKLGATQPQADQRGSRDEPVVVDMVQHAKSKEETAEAEREKQYKTFIDGWTLGIAGLVALFTGILVIIGWRGVNAARRTLMAIERQAHLMQEQNIEAREANVQATTFAQGNLRALEAQGMLMARQADLMQAQLSQWVIVDRWDSRVVQTGGPVSRAPKILEISFFLTNESNFPMTVEFDFKFFGYLPNAANLITPYPIPLLPKAPEWFSLHLYPTSEQAEVYLQSGLTIAVHGSIVHTGVSGQRSPLMELHGNLVCRTNQTFMDKRSIRLIERKPDQSEAN